MRVLALIMLILMTSCSNSDHVFINEEFGYSNPEYTDLGISYFDPTHTTDVDGGSLIDDIFVSTYKCVANTNQYSLAFDIDLRVVITSQYLPDITGYYVPATDDILIQSLPNNSINVAKVLQHEFIHYFQWHLFNMLDYYHVSEDFKKCMQNH